MLIMMHCYEDRNTITDQGALYDALVGRHTVALRYPGGVVLLSHAEVLQVLPTLQRFADEGSDPDE